MYNIWFEKDVATDYASMFEGIANGICPGEHYEQDPLHHIDIAHGSMAGGVAYNSELMEYCKHVGLLRPELFRQAVQARLWSYSKRVPRRKCGRSDPGRTIEDSPKMHGELS
jgi:hypothetical protein